MEYFKTVVSYKMLNPEGKLKKHSQQIITNSHDFKHVQDDVLGEIKRIFDGDINPPTELEIKSISKVKFDEIFDIDRQETLQNGSWYKAIVKFPDTKVSFLICGESDMSDISSRVVELVSRDTVLDFEVVQVVSTNILSVAINA